LAQAASSSQGPRPPRSSRPEGLAASVMSADPAVLDVVDGGIKTVAVFSAKSYDIEWMDKAKESLAPSFTFHYLETHLSKHTAKLAENCECVCLFVNDCCDEEVVAVLANMGVKMIALRCAGFNNVAIGTAEKLGIVVARVPAYSPFAVAEHAATLAMSLNRRIPQAWNKTRMGNFSLVGQLGMDMQGKRVGIIGTGLIGSITARIFKRGFECDVIANDVIKNPKVADAEPAGLGVPYVELDELFQTSDIISLHAPLLPATKHIINNDAIGKMKKGVIIINTSRGGLIDTKALIAGLKNKKVGGAGLDVYEEEGIYFFEDMTYEILEDEVLVRLLSFPDVIVTSHQAFFTVEAMKEISETTVRNITGVSSGSGPPKQKGTLDTVVRVPEGATHSGVTAQSVAVRGGQLSH